MVRPWLMGKEPTAESVGEAIILMVETHLKWWDLAALDHAVGDRRLAQYLAGTWYEFRAEAWRGVE